MQKMIKILVPLEIRFLNNFHRFWVDFGGILDRLGGVLEASWRGLGGLLGGLGPRKVANMAPTWPPKRSQNQLKIDPKIDQFFSASWNRFLEGFWWILDAKIEPSWRQNLCQLRKAIF